MDRYHREHPGELTPDETDESLMILAKKGIEHEKDFLASLQAEGKDVCVIARGTDASDPDAPQKTDAPENPTTTPESLTLAAMHAGRAYIYQAAISDPHSHFHGVADFLVKVPGASSLGDYHYEPWDTKLALKPKPYYIIQLCCYAEILQSIQAVLPATISVVLGSKDTKAFRTEDYYFYYKQLKARFLTQQAAFDPTERPTPTGLEDHGRWSTIAKQILEEKDDLSRVANIRKTQIKRLSQNGITTLRALAESTAAYLPKMNQSTFETLRAQAKIQVASIGLPKPKYEQISQSENSRRGLALLPPPSPHDIWFDMEGYPHIQGGLEYLFGATYLDPRGQMQFIDWWAHDRAQERKAFEDFIDWVYARYKQDATMHIYHYAAYEVSAMRKLMGRFGTREMEVDNLLRNEVFVDLYRVVQQGLRVGEPRYSLKNIEHLYMPKRDGDVAKATDSIVYYERWLEQQDGDDYATSQILKDIRDYNKIDCDSTLLLTNWLRDRQREWNIAFIPKPTKAEDETKPVADQPASTLAQRLLSEIDADPDIAEEDKRLKELLAHLLEFHRREDKPVWWAMFERAGMTDQELIDNFDCLGGLQKSAKPAVQVKTSRLIDFAFDPEQDTKLSAGKKCYLAHDLKASVTIETLDANAGNVTLKVGQKITDVPQRLNLIPDEYVNPKPIPNSILKQVDAWSSGKPLNAAIEDFFLRRRPKLIGNLSGPILTGGGTQVSQIDQINRAILSMNGTTLCIQGPPGTGKTYTASHAIAELLKAGKVVGVSSNSHKAIAHLLDKAAEVATKQDVPFNAVKVQSDPAAFHATHSAIKRVSTISDAFNSPSTQFNLIGGTAWAFSNEASEDKLDYLFVDEAGQVSIANLLGMASSTKNIVLMGDQMQLSQPIKGAHPGESGSSCLYYLLQGKQTIPEYFGIFLGITHRMHPDVCKFISDSVYEGRLHADAITASRVLVVPEVSRGIISKSAGILFKPVEHEGNTQASEEEVAAIVELVKELQCCSLLGRKITLDDILIVAPYNMQVRALQEKFPAGKVGTVDKFQGQEAPIVIVSMCSSDAGDSSRGLEFLLSKNRMNVAISRAQTLAIVVGSPNLASTACTNLEQLELVNLFCRVCGESQGLATSVSEAGYKSEFVECDEKVSSIKEETVHSNSFSIRDDLAHVAMTLPYPQMVRALIRAGSEDSPLLLRAMLKGGSCSDEIVELAKKWVLDRRERSADVLRALAHARCDDDEVFELAKMWVLGREEKAGWVLKELFEAWSSDVIVRVLAKSWIVEERDQAVFLLRLFVITDPTDLEIVELALDWVRRKNDGSSWLLRDLIETHPAHPECAALGKERLQQGLDDLYILLALLDSDVKEPWVIVYAKSWVIERKQQAERVLQKLVSDYYDDDILVMAKAWVVENRESSLFVLLSLLNETCTEDILHLARGWISQERVGKPAVLRTLLRLSPTDTEIAYTKWYMGQCEEDDEGWLLMTLLIVVPDDLQVLEAAKAWIRDEKLCGEAPLDFLTRLIGIIPNDPEVIGLAKRWISDVPDDAAEVVLALLEHCAGDTEIAEAAKSLVKEGNESSVMILCRLLNDSCDEQEMQKIACEWLARQDDDLWMFLSSGLVDSNPLPSLVKLAKLWVNMDRYRSCEVLDYMIDKKHMDLEIENLAKAWIKGDKESAGSIFCSLCSATSLDEEWLAMARNWVLQNREYSKWILSALLIFQPASDEVILIAKDWVRNQKPDSACILEGLLFAAPDDLELPELASIVVGAHIGCEK